MLRSVTSSNPFPSSGSDRLQKLPAVMGRGSILSLIGLAFCGVFWAGASSAQETSPEVSTVVSPTALDPEIIEGFGVYDDADPLSEEMIRWLDEVGTLITAQERGLFLSLKREYQRKAFVEAFWRVRDPYPRTTRTELKERWKVRVAEAKSRFGSLEDDRARVYLTHGPPAGSFEVRCTKKRVPIEVWIYRGTDWVDVSLPLLFFRQSGARKSHLWRPGFSGSVADAEIRRSKNCINGANMFQLAGAIASSQDYPQQLQAILKKPRPSSTEWVYSFRALSTELPDGAEPIEGQVDFVFPGRYQHRTVLQSVVSLARSKLGITEFAGHKSYDFQLNGEILIGDQLFESFRYKFGFAAAEVGETIPLSFQRFLRPGTYRVVLRVDDLSTAKVFRVEREVVVPQVDNLIERSTFQDPETERLFAEATAAIAAGETSIRLVPPQGELNTGFTRFDALVSGDEIKKVRFLLDDKRILTKNRPPFQVSIDLGPYPDLRSLRVEALDSNGDAVAEDELLINSGGYRFIAKLREPRKGKTYTHSLRARVEVEVPEGRTLDRVEFFLNEDRVATLYQEPFVQPIVLPGTAEVAYVRAVAYLPDGNTTEDLVFINAPDYVEEVEVQFVELYTSVVDGQGRPISGLTAGNFKVFEDEVPQSLVRFETVEDLPIHVGILIDTSASMVGVLSDVRRAALSFVDQAISPKDRAAVITFSNFPQLKVGLTSDRTALGSGLAGLAPEGQTALYDSVMFSLYYFTGIKGQRAILVLSDGKDESSRFDFEQTMEYARRAGITVYTIGLRLRDFGARSKLTRLAEETGGSSFFLNDISELEPVYQSIQAELRSQLLLAYQSSNTSDDEEFRRIEVEVDRPGARVRTISGYSP